MKRIGQVALGLLLAVAIVFVWSFAVPVQRVEAAGWLLPLLGGLGGFGTAGLALAGVLAVAGIISMQTSNTSRAVAQIRTELRDTMAPWWAMLSAAQKAVWEAAANKLMNDGGTYISSEMQADWDWWTMEFAQQEFVNIPFPMGDGWQGKGTSSDGWRPVADLTTAAGILSAAFFIAEHISGAKFALYPRWVGDWNGDLKFELMYALISEFLSIGAVRNVYFQDATALGSMPSPVSLEMVWDGVQTSIQVARPGGGYWGTRLVDNPYSPASRQGQIWTWEEYVWPQWREYLESKDWSPVPDEWTITKSTIGDATPIAHEQDLGQGVSLGPDITIVLNPDTSKYDIQGVPYPDTVIGPVPPGTVTPPSGDGDTGLLSDIKDLLSSLAGAIAAAISGVFVGDFSEVDWSRLENAMSLASTKFPFCLPWDLGRFAGIFDVPEHAVLPAISVEWPAMLGGGTLSMQIGAGLESIFSRIKWVLLIVWDIGLINWGRKWWTGGGQA